MCIRDSPCNVVVRGVEGAVRVEAVDPHMLVTSTGNEALAPVADDVAALLRAVIATLTDAPA